MQITLVEHFQAVPGSVKKSNEDQTSKSIHFPGRGRSKINDTHKLH